MKDLGRLVDLIATTHAWEKAFLTAMFLEVDQNNLLEAANVVSLRDFDRFSKHYEAMVQFKIHRRPLNQVTEESGIFITEAVDVAPPKETLLECAHKLKDSSRRIRLYRALIDISERVGKDETEKVLEDTTKVVANISADGETETADIAPLMDEYEKEQAIHRENGNKLIGFPTGFRQFDEAIDGVRPPHLWIIGGYTSVGKTAMSLNILKGIIEGGARVVLYSLEMSKVDLISRILAMTSGEEGIKILKGADDKRISDAKQFLRNAPLKVFNGKRTLRDIILSINEQKIVWSADVIIIDYLQQIAVDNADSEYESMREVAMQLQLFAEKLNIAIIGLSQVSNEAARSPNASVMGFKGAGTIASAADFAIELVPDEKDAEEFRTKSMSGVPVNVKAIIKKNRHGRTGSVLLCLEGRTGKFMERHNDLDAFVEEAHQTKVVMDDDDF